uniref:Uncharacterized protein n=1 Tax=Cacopsylla melanoneura TaxID=428564 RepID=A0A8D8QET3_9HEMI
MGGEEGGDFLCGMENIAIRLRKSGGGVSHVLSTRQVVIILSKCFSRMKLSCSIFLHLSYSRCSFLRFKATWSRYSGLLTSIAGRAACTFLLWSRYLLFCHGVTSKFSLRDNIFNNFSKSLLTCFHCSLANVRFLVIG